MSLTTITFRPKRQVTVPQLVAQQLNWRIGDQLVFEAKNKQLVVRNQNQAGQNLLNAISQSFQNSGIPLKDFLKDTRKIRRQLVEEKYGKKFIASLRRH